MAQQVTVTGGTGFVASQLIKQLLEKGYSVNATVRSTAEGTPKNQHLLRLGAAFAGSLKLFQADLGTPGAFDEAVKGSTYVFHVASPVVFTAADPQKEIVDLAVQGTENLLAAVLKSKDTVRRVLITGSVAAVYSNAALSSGKQVPKNGQLLTEEDFNTYSTVQDEPYYVSKYAAEQAALAWSQREGIPVVHLALSMVLGPVLSTHDKSSVDVVSSIFTDEPAPFFEHLISWIDVREAARAHILAAEASVVSPRYIVGTTSAYNSRWMSQVLRARFPQYKFPEGTPAQMPQAVDNSKVQRELGLQFRPAQESLIDLATSLIQLGVVKPQLL